MKAHQLINRREKWYGGGESGGIPEKKHCAWTAIIAVYGGDSVTRRAMEKRLRETIGDHITFWNDTHDWAEVYGIMLKLDI
jgi:hypothetical protein